VLDPYRVVVGSRDVHISIAVLRDRRAAQLTGGEGYDALAPRSEGWNQSAGAIELCYLAKRGGHLNTDGNSCDEEVARGICHGFGQLVAMIQKIIVSKPHRPQPAAIAARIELGNGELRPAINRRPAQINAPCRS